ncbi:hypothetical protein [Altererythrobacter aquiaggeris]|uniref:hypothetical protein n=1 Tax=Aestuarierythrobacter aquiaggeris TaxID=1898396 RepID=UPI00301AD73D
MARFSFNLLRPILAFAGYGLLAGCGGDPVDQASTTDVDPMVSAALNENLMSDPDLTGQNRANSVISDGLADGSVPLLDISPDAIGRARADAAALVGGTTEMLAAPAPARAEDIAPLHHRITVLARAQVLLDLSDNCTDRASNRAIWAARLPDTPQIYPRGAVQAASGANFEGCDFQAVKFRTPVPRGEVVDFYFTTARAAGFSPGVIMQGDTIVLSATKGSAMFAMYADTLANGLTEVDLVHRAK